MDINGVSLDVQIYKEKIGDLFYPCWNGGIIFFSRVDFLC